MNALRGNESIPVVTDAEAFEAFDHVCRYYLNMSAHEFQDRWRAQQIPEDTPNLQRVLDALPLAR